MGRNPTPKPQHLVVSNRTTEATRERRRVVAETPLSSAVKENRNRGDPPRRATCRRGDRSSQAERPASFFALPLVGPIRLDLALFSKTVLVARPATAMRMFQSILIATERHAWLIWIRPHCVVESDPLNRGRSQYNGVRSFGCVTHRRSIGRPQNSCLCLFCKSG